MVSGKARLDEAGNPPREGWTPIPCSLGHREDAKCLPSLHHKAPDDIGHDNRDNAAVSSKNSARPCCLFADVLGWVTGAPVHPLFCKRGTSHGCGDSLSPSV